MPVTNLKQLYLQTSDQIGAYDRFSLLFIVFNVEWQNCPTSLSVSKFVTKDALQTYLSSLTEGGMNLLSNDGVLDLEIVDDIVWPTDYARMIQFALDS